MLLVRFTPALTGGIFKCKPSPLGEVKPGKMKLGSHGSLRSVLYQHITFYAFIFFSFSFEKKESEF
jgi:hypothetical protein